MSKLEKRQTEYWTNYTGGSSKSSKEIDDSFMFYQKVGVHLKKK